MRAYLFSTPDGNFVPENPHAQEDIEMLKFKKMLLVQARDCHIAIEFNPRYDLPPDEYLHWYEIND